MLNGLIHHLVITFRLNFRSKQAIIYGYVVPIFFLIAFGVVFATKPPLRAEMGQLITVTVLGGACFGMPTAMVAERERGVWRRYRLLPTAIGGIIVSAMVVRFIIVLSAAIMQILLAHFCVHTPWPEHRWQMLGAFSFVCFSFLGLGLVIAMLADNVPSVQALGQAIFLPMIMIGGVGVPLRLLPVWVQRIAAFFPGRYAVQAIEACQVGGGLADARFDLFALTLIGLAAIIAGIKMFRWDIAQKLSGSARGWVSAAVMAWALVGVLAVATGRLKSDIATADFSLLGGTNPPAHTAATQAAPKIVPPPATMPDAIVQQTQPAQPWELVTKEQIDSITYDDLPDDNSTNTPLASNLDDVDTDGKKRLDDFDQGLADWPPATVHDLPQRLRNLLSICAVADVAQDQNEAQIPLIVFNYMRANIQKDQLIKALAWIILHDQDGTVLTNVKEIKELNIDADISQEDVRMRSTLYAKKLLYRLLGKMPPAQ